MERSGEDGFVLVKPPETAKQPLAREDVYEIQNRFKNPNSGSTESCFRQKVVLRLTMK